jgi:hypothetical protein
VSNQPHHRVNLSHATASFPNLATVGLASTASPILSFAPLLSPSFLFRELTSVRLSRLTHIGQPIQHVMTLLPPSPRRQQSPFNAAPAGGASVNKPSAAVPKPTLTLIKFAPRPLSEEFVKCLREVAESIIKGSPVHSLFNDHPSEIIRSSFETFYLSPYFAKFLSTFDTRIGRDSKWFSMLNECEALLNQEALPEPHGLPQLTLQIHIGRVKPLAQRALHELANTQEAAKETLLRQWLAPEGLILASRESDLYQILRTSCWIERLVGIGQTP